MGRFLAVAFLLLLAYTILVVSYGPVSPTMPPTTTRSAHSTAHNTVVIDYRAIAATDARQAGINPTLFIRQINQESGFNPYAVSHAGAIGIAQFMPATASGLGVNPWEPVQSLRAAAQLMAHYYRQYGSYSMALAAYNAGPGAMNRALSSCGLQWFLCLTSETENYITAITE